MTFSKKNIIYGFILFVVVFVMSTIGSFVYFYPEKTQSYRVATSSYLSSHMALSDMEASLPELDMAAPSFDFVMSTVQFQLSDYTDALLAPYMEWRTSWDNWENPIKPVQWYQKAQSSISNYTVQKYNSVVTSVQDFWIYIVSIPSSIQWPTIAVPSITMPQMPTVLLAGLIPFQDYNESSSENALNAIEPAVGANEEIVDLKAAQTIDENSNSSQGTSSADGDSMRDLLFNDFEERTIVAEAVLVPRAKTVISSSRDGKIAKIHFDNGDHFKKGDILLEYRCAAVKAEIDAAVVQNRLAREKRQVVTRLYNMDLASRIEKLEAQAESKKATATKDLTESQNDDCIIRADYDGRVVKRLANPGEYTRTDRILLEVASKGMLDVEFLLPSLWLRWVNIDAPFSLQLHETGATYPGKIKRIFGEVDPVSQSIQIRASLDDYDHPLLPGMSGQINLDIRDIRSAGIRGFLDVQQQ